MKRASLFLVVAIAVAALLVIRDRGAQRDVREVKIGVMLPLSGGAAALGKTCLNGAQLAVDEANAQKGDNDPSIRLLVQDDQAKPAIGLSVFEKFASVDRLKIILGPLASGVALAVAPLAERQHIVLLSPGASAPTLTNAGDYIFRNEVSEQYGARIQAELAVQPLGFKRIALLYVNNEYGVGTIGVFRRRFEELGGTIVADEAYAAGTTDFRTALTKVKAAAPDALFVVWQDDIVNIIKQKDELGVEGKVYTTAIFESAEILAKLGPLADGVVYSYYGTFDVHAQSGPAAEFSKRYETRFGQAPDYYSALGYDAAAILARALRDVSFNPEQVKDALYRIQQFPGVSGETSFDKNGDVTKPVSLKVVKGGKFGRY